MVSKYNNFCTAGRWAFPHWYTNTFKLSSQLCVDERMSWGVSSLTLMQILGRSAHTCSGPSASFEFGLPPGRTGHQRKTRTHEYAAGCFGHSPAVHVNKHTHAGMVLMNVEPMLACYRHKTKPNSALTEAGIKADQPNDSAEMWNALAEA